MICTIRFPQALIALAQRDLDRHHPFALERVGFFHARVASVGAHWLILPYVFVAIPDEAYIRDETVGARIGAVAIRSQMEAALSGSVAILHVHKHDHAGLPSFSHTDRLAYPAMLRALQGANPNMPHGAIVLSQDSARAVALLPGAADPQLVTRIVVVGRPMRIVAAEENGNGRD